MAAVYRLDRARAPRKESGPGWWANQTEAKGNNRKAHCEASGDGSQLARLQARFAAAGLALDPLSGDTLLVQYCGMHRVLHCTADAWQFLRMFERRQGVAR